MINREEYKNRSVDSINSDIRELQQVIRKNKDNQEEKAVEEYTSVLLNWISDGDFTERDIKGLMKDFMREIRHIEME